MKSLYIIRHAKSDWNAAYGGDHERPLNKRGVRSAKLMGSFLADAGEKPDMILTSTAARARTTVELMAEAGGFADVAVRATRDFYESHPDRVLEEIRTTADEHASLLVAGHEPTWSGLVALLTGARVRMVTATLAKIDLAANRWAEVDEGTGELVFLLPPRLLLAADRERS